MIGNSPGQRGRPRLDGAAVARLSHRAHRRRRARERQRRDRDSFAPAHRRSRCRGYQNEHGRAHADRGRILSDRRRRLARRRRLHHLHRPRRRRVQIERLSLEPVRARKRADRTCRRSRRPRSCRRPIRCATRSPKAMSRLPQGHAPDRATAAAIFKHMRGRLSAYKLVRRIEFFELPKTISGKIRRVELRQREERARRARRTGGSGIQDRGFSGDDRAKTAPLGRRAGPQSQRRRR